MAPTNYNFTENGVIYTFDDAFIQKEMFGSELYLWGENIFYGQVGDNTKANRSTPRQEFTSSTNWKQVSYGGNHVAAIKTDGTLWAWGDNSSGQLGDGTNATRSTPRQEFTSSTNWKLVSAGGAHTLAIKTDGTLWAWGSNSFGQVGDGTNASRSTPRQVGTATNWKQVSAAVGNNHSLAITNSGTLWAWGNNSNGQIGDNTAGLTSRSTPRQVGTANNWKQASAGSLTSAAIKTDGTLWCWGNNTQGQIADNTTTSRLTPRQEFTSTTIWKQVSVADHVIAVKTDGTLWAWGNNSNGQIGDNTAGLTSRSTPRQVGTATNWKKCARADSSSSIAIKTDGTLWAWGDNAYGQVGDNTASNSRSTPRQIGTETNWKDVSGTAAIKFADYPILY
jgi:alpha-tubulin suppressor-like RCC1 family protein